MLNREERKALKLARSKAELVRTVVGLVQMTMTAATLIILIYVNFMR